MAMLLISNTTLLSRAPVPGKSSPAAALQLRSRQPPAAAASVALRWASCKESRSRAALFACHAYNYDIKPSALVHPRQKDDGDWRLTDEQGRITLRFNVGARTTKDDLEVATMEDQVLLVIKKKKKSGDSQAPASSPDLDVRLLMPPGYDSNKMEAVMLSDGWLQISIPKPMNKPIPITFI